MNIEYGDIIFISINTVLIFCVFVRLTTTLFVSQKTNWTDLKLDRWLESEPETGKFKNKFFMLNTEINELKAKINKLSIKNNFEHHSLMLFLWKRINMSARDMFDVGYYGIIMVCYCGLCSSKIL